MKNPLELPPPSDPVKRVRALAHDLAYGAVHGMWSSDIPLTPELLTELSKMLGKKWNDIQPDFKLLQISGYLSSHGIQGVNDYYKLTPKALALLEAPELTQPVFISYGRKQSSTFGLLIKCELSAIDITAFIDTNIDPGIKWHNELEAKVRGSSCFICIIGPKTLDSSYVQREIWWALDANVKSIPIWHPGFVFNKQDISDCPYWLEKFVNSTNAIRVMEESAEGYNDAIKKLLVSLKPNQS